MVQIFGADVRGFDGDANACTGANVISPTLSTSSSAVTGLAEASVDWTLPSDVQFRNVLIARTTHGFGAPQQAGNPQEYVARTRGGVLESMSLTDATHADKSGVATFPAVSEEVFDRLTVGVKCATAGPNVSCPASDPVSVDIDRIGMQVVESATADTKPKMAVGGLRSPAAGVLELDVRATDAGLGLRSAEASFESGPVVRASFTDIDARYSACRDLTSNATVDMPIDAVCPAVGAVTLAVDTSPLSDGDHVLTIRVVDWSGKEAVQQETISIANSTPFPSPSPLPSASPSPSPRRPLAVAVPSPSPSPSPSRRRRRHRSRRRLPPSLPARRWPRTGGRARSRSGLRPRAVSGSSSRCSRTSSARRR